MMYRKMCALMMWLGAAVLSVGVAQAGVLPGPLVTAKWLHDNMKAVQVVDVRDDVNSLMNDPKYSTVDGKKVLDEVGGHITDALSVNFWGLRVKRDIDGKSIDFLLPSADEFQQRMRGVQLEQNKPIVIAPTGDDATSLQEAAFFAYELQLFGVPADQISILNGGTHAWIVAGYPIDTDAIAPMTSSKWTAKPPRADMLATTEQVQGAQRAHKLLLDARPLAQFIGLEHTPAVAGSGRLAGAKPFPSEMLYQRDADGSWRFLQASQYKIALALGGVRHVGRGIIYCNTGQYAAGAWFILDRIMGIKGLKEYPGGINEWMQRGLPVEKI